MGFLDWFKPIPQIDGVDLKAAAIPFTRNGYANGGYSDPLLGTRYVNDWDPVEWIDTSWSSMVDQIYSINSAVTQCILKLAQGYPEPPPLVRINDEVRDDHPLSLLLARPNPQMSHAELMGYRIVYSAVGGDMYLHKIRNRGNQVVELWPYHAGQLWPIASKFGWVDEYEYETANGEKRRIKASEIIHLKWPLIDLKNPIRSLSPLAAIAREVLSDSEATRFLAALLTNNAVPLGVVTLPEGTAMSPQKADQLRDKWKKDHGGKNGGGIVILEQGASYERVSMNMQELALDALRRVPEARIAGAFGVPPIVAGLNVGLEKATYANYETAVTQMTRGTFVPLWRSDGQELTQALSHEFPGNATVAYDTSKVAALQESTDQKFARATAAFEANAMAMDEYRALIDLPPWDTIAPGDGRGKYLSYELQPVRETPRRVIDAIVKPQQITQEDEE